MVATKKGDEVGDVTKVEQLRRCRFAVVDALPAFFASNGWRMNLRSEAVTSLLVARLRFLGVTDTAVSSAHFLSFELSI